MVLSSFDHNAVGLLIAAIGATGAILNFKLYNRLSKEPNKLWFNLFLVNMGMIVLAFPFPVVSSLSHKWAFSGSMCIYYGTISLVLGFNVMLTTVLICLDLLFEKKFENYEFNKSSIRNCMLTFAWINSIFWGLAPMFGWSRIGPELTDTSCTVDFVNAGPAYTTYIISVFLIMFIFPIVAALFVSSCNNKEVKPAEAQKLTENDQIIMALLVLFVPVWTPYAVCYLWPLFYNIKLLSVTFNAYAPVIAKLSVITNPTIYLYYKSVAKRSKTQ